MHRSALAVMSDMPSSGYASCTGGRCAGGVVYAINHGAVDFCERFGFRGLSETLRSPMVTLAEFNEASHGR